VRRLSQGAIDPRPLLSRRAGLGEIAAALADLRAHPDLHTKVIIDPTLG
jgi:threonine dehydrogenase-like Zn-dependent dehydrogenase